MGGVRRNAQVAQSRRLIEDALLRLMKREAFKDITVTQICQEAQVARQTFYRYYRSSAEVLEQHIFDLWKRHQEAHSPFSDDLAEVLLTMYQNLPLSRELLETLGKNNLFYLEEQAEREVYMLQSADAPLRRLLSSELYDRYFVAFIASTINCVLRLWTEGGFKESPRELADLTLIFFAGTVVNRPSAQGPASTGRAADA